MGHVSLTPLTPSPRRRWGRPFGLAVGALLGLLLGFGTSAQAASCPKGWKSVKTHEVASGQTVSSIAARYDVSVKDIQRANPGLDPDRVRAGQDLLICRPPASKTKSASKKTSSRTGARCSGDGRIIEHEVASGETLSRIAGKYNVRESAIISRNKTLKENPDRLRVGQTLRVCVDANRVANAKSCGYKTPLHRHKVVPGEYIAVIASRYGVRRSDLYRLNRRLEKNPDYLRPGDEVLVCPDIPPRYRTEIEHTVQSGETFGEIAKRYDVSSRELLRFQRGKLDDPSRLRVGQKLRVWVDTGLVPGFGAYDDDEGVLKVGMLLPKGKGYTTKPASLRWGTPTTVRLIQAALAKYWSRNKGGPDVHVGDISRKGGGPFPPHKSHQTGLDVDVGYVLKGQLADVTRFRSATAKTMDVARSWKLIKAFLDTRKVRYIFVDYRVQKLLYEHARETGVSEDTLDELFQYPRGKRRARGIIRHWKGHHDHFHVRFRG